VNVRIHSTFGRSKSNFATWLSLGSGYLFDPKVPNSFVNVVCPHRVRAVLHGQPEKFYRSRVGREFVSSGQYASRVSKGDHLARGYLATEIRNDFSKLLQGVQWQIRSAKEVPHYWEEMRVSGYVVAASAVPLKFLFKGAAALGTIFRIGKASQSMLRNSTTRFQEFDESENVVTVRANPHCVGWQFISAKD
jgi:hypothetical protein